jgi:hypothetical protein
VSQALALNTPESICGPFPIGQAKAGTIIVAEVELGEIALQMRFETLTHPVSHFAALNVS